MRFEMIVLTSVFLLKKIFFPPKKKSLSCSEI